jgi:hypothetical protein
LTVLAGANSSGKSSLLQALLFFAQSFGESAAVINGDLVRLGEGVDVIRNGTDRVALEVRAQPGDGTDAQGRNAVRRLRISLDSPAGRGGLLVAELSLWNNDACLVDLARVDAPDGMPVSAGEQILGSMKDSGALEEVYLAISGITPLRIMFRVEETDLERIVFETVAETGKGRFNILQEMLQVAGEADLDELTHLQTRFARNDVISQDDPDLPKILARYAEFIAPERWMTSYIAAPAITAQRLAGMRFGLFTASDYMPAEVVRLVNELSEMLNRAQRLAASVVYLGPLRDDPRVAYPLGHTVGGLPVGEKGEFTAAYLLENSSETIRYGSPSRGTRSTSLSTAVAEWCTYLGIADAVKVEPFGKLGHQLRLRVSGALRDPTAIGVGASQLLPVVALVLGSSPGAIVLMEQPELHLHPKVQSRLADFFVLARPDVRLIVETHSENLVTRLRLRAAEGILTPPEVSVLFAAQRAGDDGQDALVTEFRKLSIDELGNFDYWPENFFDALDDDGAALAKAVSARMEAKRVGPAGE